jgi:hypothetical protein
MPNLVAFLYTENERKIKETILLGVMTLICNPSYLGSRGQEFEPV